MRRAAAESSPPEAADYAIVPYRPEHRGQVLALQAHLWRHDPALRSAYLDWKYHRNPSSDGEEPLVQVACHGSRVVGMRGFWGARFQAGLPRVTLRMPCAGDVVIGPGHRVRGLFAALTAAALERVAERGDRFVLNTSAGDVTHASCLALGWRGIGSLRMMRRRRAGAATAPVAGDPFERLERNARSGRRAIDAALSVDRAPRPREMAEVIERCALDARLRPLRDERTLAWRFENPFSRYRFLYWDGDGGLEGYLVLRGPVEGDREQVVVLDWEAPDPRVRRALLEAALAWSDFGTLSLWSATLPETTRAHLRALGFEPWQGRGPLARSQPTILVGPARREDRALPAERWTAAGLPLCDLSSWDPGMIVSDGY
jgi:hypothetical protein